ncbi:hypothetical protein CHUAL_005556 [Chamberlinius hualienensis]
MSSSSKLTNLSKAANSCKLPSQLIDCLIASGYDCISSVAAITELSTIENFFRTNSHIYSQEEINKIYGRFASKPERFCFLPGYQTQLQEFIEYCRRYNKDGKGSVTLAGYYQEKTPKRPRQRNRARPFKMMKTEDKLTAITQETINSQSGEGETLASGYAILHSQEDGGDVVLPIIHAGGSLMPTQEQAESMADIFKRLQNRIKNWCLTNQNEEIQQLKFRVDYDINMTPIYETASSEEKEKSLRLEDQFGCQIHVTCLSCSRVIRLHPQRGGFCTSNVFRHFTSCRVKKSKKLHDTTLHDSTLHNSSAMIQFLISETTEIQANDEVEINEEANDEVEINEEATDEVEINEEAAEEEQQQLDEDQNETMGEVQQMIYVSDAIVDADDRENTVSIRVVQEDESI